jgi:hypothetical protein
MKIEFDTMRLFNAIQREKCLVVYGDVKPSWNIIYEDMSQVKTDNFYKIINPYPSVFTERIFVFQEIIDTLKFFLSKPPAYFNHSRIAICDRFSKLQVVKFVKEFTKTPKLCLFHRQGSADLWSFLLDIYGIDSEIDKKGLTVYFKTSKIFIGCNELTKIPEIFRLNKLKMKNKILSDEFLNTNILI